MPKKKEIKEKSKDKTKEKTKAKEKKNVKFSIGDYAVYPAHGVGTIESIETQEINGEELRFYVIKIISNSMTIMVPIANAKKVGLRDVIPKEEISNLYKTLKESKTISIEQTWNRRHKEYADKIKTGSLYDIAEVFRNLSLLKAEKELSFGERKLFDTAKDLLVKEISISKDMSEKNVEEELYSHIKKK